MGQTWQSTQARDKGRLVRIAGKKGGRFQLAPLDPDHARSSMSEKTLRKVYALVAFRVVDAKGRPIGPVETHSAAIKRRMAIWAEHAKKQLGILLVDDGIVHPIVDGYEAFNARNTRR